MMIWCITWKRFDQLILLLIFANSLILALADYSEVDADGNLDTASSNRNAVVNYADRLFTTLFSVECTMKIVAMGLFGETGAYLMDPWNWMDFIVVFIGYVPPRLVGFVSEPIASANSPRRRCTRTAF